MYPLWYAACMENGDKKMEKIYAARRERLRTAIERAHGSMANAAKAWKMPKDTLYSYTGQKRRLHTQTVLNFAERLGEDSYYLLARDISDDGKAADDTMQGSFKTAQVPVFGQSAGGVWLESEMALNETEDIVSVPASNKAKPQYQYARKVVGSSVSNRIPDGCYAIFVRREFFPGPIPYGSLVDIHRERSGLHEYSIKAYYGNTVSTDSRELAEQQILPLEDGDSDTVVIIEGVAVGFYGDI